MIRYINRTDPQDIDQATTLITSERFPTSEGVVNRIRWDDTFDFDSYFVGYKDRFVGIQEISLSQFVDLREDSVYIPYHRVWYIRDQNGKVWDRATRKVAATLA